MCRQESILTSNGVYEFTNKNDKAGTDKEDNAKIIMCCVLSIRSLILEHDQVDYRVRGHKKEDFHNNVIYGEEIPEQVQVT